MSTAVKSTSDQPQFVASDTDVVKHGVIGDLGSPMQEDEILSLQSDLDHKLADIETPTPEELAKIVRAAFLLCFSVSSSLPSGI